RSRARSSTRPHRDVMSASPVIRKHPVGWYRASLLVLVMGVGYLLLSGRLVASIRALGNPNMPHDEFFHHFLTNVLWVASVTLFFWFSPVFLPHTQRVEIWLAVSGLLMGGTMYCQERSRPYLRPEWLERNRGRFFGPYWTANPANYDRSGKWWVFAHWVLVVLL